MAGSVAVVVQVLIIEDDERIRALLVPTQVLAMLRAVSDVPVIVASARDDDPSLVGALDSGADDYVVKPYTTAQLEARIRAVLRRAGGGRETRADPGGRRAQHRRGRSPGGPLGSAARPDAA